MLTNLSSAQTVMSRNAALEQHTRRLRATFGYVAVALIGLVGAIAFVSPSAEQMTSQQALQFVIGAQAERDAHGAHLQSLDERVDNLVSAEGDAAESACCVSGAGSN